MHVFVRGEREGFLPATNGGEVKHSTNAFAQRFVFDNFWTLPVSSHFRSLRAVEDRQI